MPCPMCSSASCRPTHRCRRNRLHRVPMRWPAPAMSAAEEDVLSALVNLGYQRAAAEKALASIPRTGQFDAMFRQALAALSK